MEEVQSVNEQDNILGSTVPKKRKLTSHVWRFFDRIPIGDDKKQRSKCKKCGRIYIADGTYGTTNMSRHIKNCPKNDTRDIGQLILGQTSNSFNAEKFRELLTSAVVMHELPFQFVDWIGIRALLTYLRKDLHIVTRNTCKSDCLKLYEKEKIKMQNMLDETLGRISFTSDCWSSLTTDGYICLTAHFIDKEWKLQKRIINFCSMPSPHTGFCLSEKIMSFLLDWKLSKRVSTITLDNASANDTCIGYLKTKLGQLGGLVLNGKYMHIRCCAHILNLIVQDGLKEIDPAVQKVRDSIKYVKGSQGRKQKFLECVSHSSLESKRGLRQDVLTRWNSTFIMLESAIYYRLAFMHLQLSDSNYIHCPSREEWDSIQKICKFLRFFYNITCLFSGSKYPTANLYFPEVYAACITLKEEMRSSDEYMKKMANNMYAKFEKYWSDFNEILAIAVILDPRYKLGFVEWCYKKVYGDRAAYECHCLKEKLIAFYNEYAGKKLNASGTTSMSGSGNIGTTSTSSYNDGPPPYVYDPSFSQETTNVFKEFDSYELEETGSQKSQLEQYLEDQKVDRKSNLDVLAYWKANEFRYPEVAAMARDVLCIPVSTVASESAFSVGGRVLDQYRSTLKPKTVEALICTKDWLYGSQEFEKHIFEDLTPNVIQCEEDEFGNS